MDKVISGIFFNMIQCRRKSGGKYRWKKITIWMDAQMEVHFTILSSFCTLANFHN